MQNRNQLINELRMLLSRKQSREYYAHRLHITEAQVDDLMNEIRGLKSSEETSSTKRLNVEKGEVEVSGYWKTEPTTEQIMESHNIDSSKYQLSQYWSKQKSKGFQVSACFKAVKQDSDYLATLFTDFLKEYKPAAPIITYNQNIEFDARPYTCLILNTQDAHYNKYDIKGDNSIKDRFSKIEAKITKIVSEASFTSNLGKIIYTIGSDCFNSEWTGFTTHGTPQTNLLDFHRSFEAICEHQISVINYLLSSSTEVEILFVPGNHDQYVGWSLIKWLQAYYRNQKNLTINTEPSYTKYTVFGSTALCFNHGYKIKPEALVMNFAKQCKEFSSSDYQYVFVGDKHTEHSKSIGGVKVFRLSTVSKAVSDWDEENGYDLQLGEMTAFLIDSQDGMTRTYYEPIK